MGIDGWFCSSLTLPSMYSQLRANPRDQIVVDRVWLARRVDDEVAIRVLLRLFEVALPDAAVEGFALRLDAVLGRVELFAPQQRVHACLCGLRIDIEDNDEVGPVLAQRDTADGEDVGDGQAAGAALVGKGRGDEPVGDHEFATLDRRLDTLGDELRPAGHEQQHLAAQVHRMRLLVLRIEQHLADLLADVRPAGLAHLADGHMGLLSRLDETIELGRLPAAIGPIEHKKPAAQTVGEVVIQRCIRHHPEHSGKAGEFVAAYDRAMPTPTPDHYLSPYQQAHVDHGSEFRVTLWANERSQRLRFKVMTEMVFMLGKRVLDAGCSRGDFAAYLLEKDVAYESFVGIDAVEPVITFAQSRGLARSQFVAGDFVRDASFFAIDSPQVLAISGSLNTMDDEMVFGLLDNAWRATGETLVFNFLSDRASDEAPRQTHPARRLPTMALLDWALSRTPNVRMRQDYFRYGHDATIVMRKD